MIDVFRGVKQKLNDDMQVVIGYAELADELGRHGGDASEHVRSIALAASKAIERIEQLAALNAVWQTRLEPVDLNAILRANMKVLEAGLPPIVTLKLELEPLTALINADRDRLGLSFTHLIRLATANMPYGGEIIVSTRHGLRREREGSGSVIAQVLAIKGISKVGSNAGIDNGLQWQSKSLFANPNDDFESSLEVCEALLVRAAECDVSVSHSPVGTKFTTRFATGTET